MSDCLFLVGINFSVFPLPICQILLVIMAKILFDILSKLTISTSFFQKFLREGVQWPPSPNSTPLKRLPFCPFTKLQIASLFGQKVFCIVPLSNIGAPFLDLCPPVF